MLTKSQGLVFVCLFVFYYKSLLQQFLPTHDLARAAGRAQDSAGSQGETCICCAACGQTSRATHTSAGFGENTGDIVSWVRRMPTFIFGIVSWMWRDECFCFFFIQNRGQETRRSKEVWKLYLHSAGLSAGGVSPPQVQVNVGAFQIACFGGEPATSMKTIIRCHLYLSTLNSPPPVFSLCPRLDYAYFYIFEST